MDGSPPGSSVHGISQARILQWVAISFSKGSSRLMDQIDVFCISRQILHHGATREVPLICRNTNSRLPVILHHGELHNYFIIYHYAIIIEIKYTINVMCLNYPETITLNPTPGPSKNYFLWNQSLVPKKFGTAGLPVIVHKSNQEWIEGIEISGQCGELI